MKNVDRLIKMADMFETKIKRFATSTSGDESQSYGKYAAELALDAEMQEYNKSTPKSKFFSVLNQLAKKGPGSFKYGGECMYFATKNSQGKWVVDPSKSGFKLESSGSFDVNTNANLKTLVQSFNKSFVQQVQMLLDKDSSKEVPMLKDYDTVDHTAGIFINQIISW